MIAGEIRVEQAYAQGKMLCSSSWNGILPRGITPSDVDLVFDDGKQGAVLFCEFSSHNLCWAALDAGQRWLYESLVKAHPRSMAVLLSHHVPATRQIDTLTDVDMFSPMWWDDGLKVVGPIKGDWWRHFVCWFYGNYETPRWVAKWLV